MRPPRGAALPETAVVLGTALTLLFGLVELGVVGYTQLSADGAAYVAAHASVLGKDPLAAVASPFPRIAQNGTVRVQANAPDATDVAVDYQISNQSSRVGGVQVVRPAHTQATVGDTEALPGGPGLGVPSATLGGAAIEGNMLVSAPGYDLAGTGLNTGATYAAQKSYFSDDGNAPPYFIGFRYIWDCTGLGAGKGNGYCAGSAYRALGLAEYLDADNWGLPNDGIGPNAVYGAMSLHYQTYADLAAKLPAYGGELDPAGTAPQDLCLQRIQSWDVTLPSGTTTNPRAYPLNPNASTPGC